MSSTNGQSCVGCEVIPASVPTSGTLYLAPPLNHTLAVIKQHLHALGVATLPAPDQTIALAIDELDLAALTLQLAAALTGPELQSTPALIVEAGAEPGIADFLRARSLDRLVAQVRGAWLSALLADNRLVTHFQPIIHSHEPDRVFGYECLMRGVGADGGLIPPRELYESATGAGILFHLDRAARIGSIRNARANKLDGYIFINFSPASIYNPAFCLRSTAGAAAESGISPERIVFEVVESEEIHDTDHLLSILKVYRDAGFKIALDDLGSGYGSLNLLHRLRPDFVKLDMGLVRGVDQDPFKATIAAKLLEAANESGIATIAEGIETAEEWAWLRDHGADYQQGYLFARPALPAPVPVAPTIAATLN